MMSRRAHAVLLLAQIVLHGGGRSFQVQYCMLWLRKTLFSCFYQCCKTDKRRRFSVCGHATALAATVARTTSPGGNRADARRSGAVFWLWVSAFVGAVAAFAENTLGMLYRRKGSDGGWRGAMLYLKNGLRSPLMAAKTLRYSACCLIQYQQHESITNSISAGTLQFVRHIEAGSSAQ